jgi:hypothetical protein
MTTTTLQPKLASLKQVKYIVDLANQRIVAGKVTQPVQLVVEKAKRIVLMLPTRSFDDLVLQAGVTGQHASVAIDALLAIKPEPKPGTAGDYARLQAVLENIPEGFYALPRKVDGVWDFFQVVTKAKGARWVNQLVGGNRKILSLTMQAAAARAIADDQKAAALAYAKWTKNCPKCGTRLTRARSLAAKIGPSCAKAWGWAW